MGRDIFISYSQPDRDCAYDMTRHLEASGFTVWIAPRDVSPAAEWAEEIIDAISAARVMVLVFSASSNTSPQVRREVERAVHRRVSVLPFRVEDVLPSSSLEYFLASQHWLDAFPPPLEPHYARLCRYLKTTLAAPSIQDAASATTGTVRTAPPPPSSAALRALEGELARYIGPVARHLVRRAVAHCSGTEALLLELGAEIEAEADRRAFLSAARSALRAHA